MDLCSGTAGKISDSHGASIAQGIAYSLIPLLGVPPALFGMTKGDLEDALGKPEDRSTSFLYYYHRHCFKVNFDDSDRVAVLELSNCREQFEVGIWKSFHPPPKRWLGSSPEILPAQKPMTVIVILFGTST